MNKKTVKIHYSGIHEITIDDSTFETQEDFIQAALELAKTKDQLFMKIYIIHVEDADEEKDDLS
jgi:hypothetical protein